MKKIKNLIHCHFRNRKKEGGKGESCEMGISRKGERGQGGKEEGGKEEGGKKEGGKGRRGERRRGGGDNAGKQGGR